MRRGFLTIYMIGVQMANSTRQSPAYTPVRLPTRKFRERKYRLINPINNPTWAVVSIGSRKTHTHTTQDAIEGGNVLGQLFCQWLGRNRASDPPCSFSASQLSRCFGLAIQESATMKRKSYAAPKQWPVHIIVREIQSHLCVCLKPGSESRGTSLAV